MEQATRYTVTVFLAAPGTPLKSGGVSPRGQMYLQVAEGEDTHSYGFAPPRLPPGETAKGVQYAQVRHDDADEHVDPYYSRTLEITAEHYGCLRDFAEEPAEFEFDVDRPATINRCSDFVWAALNYAGLHPLPTPLDGGSDLGEFAVLFNLPEIQCIAAPFPDSDLNAESHHPMPERGAEDHRQGHHAEGEPPPSPMEVAGTLLDPSHPDHRLFAQLIQKVAELDAAHGRTFDDSSQRISASLLVLAKQNNLSRVDHVLLSRSTRDAHAAESIFIVQGDRDDPAHRRASIPTEVAVQTDVADSLRLKEQ